MTSSENDLAANWEKSVLNSAIGFNQVTHSVLWKKIIQFSGFVFLPIHMPFPVIKGVALCVFVVPQFAQFTTSTCTSYAPSK